MRVERSIVLPAPPDDVWRAVAEPDRLASWFGGDVELDARPGGRVVVADEDGDRWGTVEAIQPGHRLVLRLWQQATSLTGTRLEFILDGDETGTRLTVVETQLVLGAGARAGGRPARPERRGRAVMVRHG